MPTKASRSTRFNFWVKLIVTILLAATGGYVVDEVNMPVPGSIPGGMFDL